MSPNFFWETEKARNKTWYVASMKRVIYWMAHRNQTLDSVCVMVKIFGWLDHQYRKGCRADVQIIKLSLHQWHSENASLNSAPDKKRRSQLTCLDIQHKHEKGPPGWYMRVQFRLSSAKKPLAEGNNRRAPGVECDDDIRILYQINYYNNVARGQDLRCVACKRPGDEWSVGNNKPALGINLMRVVRATLSQSVRVLRARVS